MHVFYAYGSSGIFLGMGSANERRRYYVTPPLIGRAHTQIDPWLLNTLRPEQNGWNFSDNIFINKNLHILLKISQKFDL